MGPAAGVPRCGPMVVSSQSSKQTDHGLVTPPATSPLVGGSVCAGLASLPSAGRQVFGCADFHHLSWSLPRRTRLRRPRTVQRDPSSWEQVGPGAHTQADCKTPAFTVQSLSYRLCRKGPPFVTLSFTLLSSLFLGVLPSKKHHSSRPVQLQRCRHSFHICCSPGSLNVSISATPWTAAGQASCPLILSPLS